MRTRVYVRWLAAFVMVAALSACIPQRAIDEVNKVFGAEDDEIVREQGTRTYSVRKELAFRAMQTSIVDGLDMRISAQDFDAGYLRARAPAPRPLSDEEWEQTVKAELPRMQKILAEQVGFIAYFLPFDPKGLDIVIDVTLLEQAPDKCEVSVSWHMLETSPAPSRVPRRAYPPPYGVRIAIDKFWGSFERELTSLLAGG